MLQVNPSFYTSYSKNSLFVSAHTFEKYIVSKEYSFARHGNKMCFQPICRYHNKLIGDVKEFLRNLDAFYFNYQHVNCLYTLFMYQYGGKIVFNFGQVFDKVQRAVHFNHQKRGLDKLPCIAKKKVFWGKSTKAIFELLPEDQAEAN